MAPQVDYCKFYNRNRVPEISQQQSVAAETMDVLSLTTGPPSRHTLPAATRPGNIGSFYGPMAGDPPRPATANNINSGFSAYMKGTEHHLREGYKAYLTAPNTEHHIRHIPDAGLAPAAQQVGGRGGGRWRQAGGRNAD